MDTSKTYNVIIIGAGIAGCCAAREIARYDASIAVLEEGIDIAPATTRANSGIVHAGYDPEPGSLKAHYNVAGSKIYPRWAEELGFPFAQNGSLVLAFSEEELETVHELVARAEKNGCEDVRFITGEEVRELEPNVAPDVMGALFAERGGICDPVGVTIAAAENAAANGVEFFFDTKVELVAPEAQVPGLPDGTAGYRIETSQGTYYAQAVVNCAGVFADEINNMVSARKLEIQPVRGDYCLYSPDYGTLFKRTMFQTPSSAGKGILVAPTIHGNLFVGPNAVAQDSKTSVATTTEGLEECIRVARKTWPEASANGIITNFAGLRARAVVAPGEHRDFVIGPVDDAPGFFNIACFESPGLTSAPAVAEDMGKWVGEYLGASLKKDFDPHRDPTPLFALMSEEERAAMIAKDPAWGHVVCRCCKVTEAEVVAACHGPLPLLCIDALKWRTGTMMGPCHGGFCMPDIIQIVSRELDLRPEEIQKRYDGSWIISRSRTDFTELVQEGSGVGSAPVKDGELGADDVYDVAIVGAGAAGLAAAKAAVEQGAESVIVIDRARAFGGIMNQCIHNGFGLHRFKEELTGPEYAARQVADLEGMPVRFFMGATVLGGDLQGEGPKTLAVFSPEGREEIRAHAVVFATGSRERGVGAMNLSGDRPSGVYTAGSAQAMINLQGCLPGKRAVIMGTGDIGLIMARRMVLSGMEVIGMFSRGPKVSGLQRNVVQCLEDFGIPLFMCQTIVGLEGDDRLSAVIVANTDPETKIPIPGTEHRVECDTLILSIGLVPENDVAQECGVELGSRGGVEVDKECASNIPGVFACGNAVKIHDLADNASKQGDTAGASAALYALQAKGGSHA